jgi:hypothetical protein
MWGEAERVFSEEDRADNRSINMLMVGLHRQLKGESAVKKHWVILNAVLITLFLGVEMPQFAQDAPAGPASVEPARRRVALGLLRAINTAEVWELNHYGSYASWETLLSHQPEYLNGFLAMNYPQKENVHFGEMPEVLPGWSLRFNVHADGKGYDMRLQDLTDKKCWYTALTDESGVIRQSKVIDCEI